MLSSLTRTMQGPIAMAVGARDRVLVRDTFQRALVASAIIFVLVALPSVAVSKWVFQLFGQEDNISITTTICLAINLPGEFSCILYTMLYRTMIAQLMVRSHCCRAVASMGQGGGGNCPPPILGVAPQSGLAPATIVSLRLAMGQLRLEKCIKTNKIQ